MNVRFVWDEAKNEQNKLKHGVSFEEAVTIFGAMPFAVFFDPDHSEDEDRYIAIGVSARNRVLLVVHCEDENGAEVRIISARRATKREQRSAFGGR